MSRFAWLLWLLPMLAPAQDGGTAPELSVEAVRFTVANAEFTLMHEMGHLLISELQLPVLAARRTPPTSSVSWAFPVAAGTAPRRFLRQADGRRRLLPYGMAERGTRRLPGTGLGQPCAGRPALLQHCLPGLRQRPGSARLGAGSQRPAGGTSAVLPRRIRAGRPCRAVVSRALRAQRRATAATPHQGGLRHPPAHLAGGTELLEKIRASGELEAVAAKASEAFAPPRT